MCMQSFVRWKHGISNDPFNILSPMLATSQWICISNISPQITDHCIQTRSFTFHSYVWSSLLTSWLIHVTWNCLLLFESIRHKLLETRIIVEIGIVSIFLMMAWLNCKVWLSSTPLQRSEIVTWYKLLNLDILFNTSSTWGKFVTWYKILNLDIL